MELAVRDPSLTGRVGAVALLALAGLAALVVALDGCTLRSAITATVYFEHTGGLREGARVQAAGKIIGEVTAIALVPAQKAGPGHPLHRSGGVAAHIRVHRRDLDRAPVNGEYFIATHGLVGTRYIEIGPPPGVAPPERPLGHGDGVRGVDPPHMDRVLQRTYRNLQIARSFAREVGPEARELLHALRALSATLASLDTGEPAQVRERVGQAADEARALGAAWAQADVSWEELTRLVREARATADRLTARLDDLGARLGALQAGLARARERVPPEPLARLEAALATARESLDRARRTVATVRELADLVASGEGTVGALLHDPEFPEHAKELGRIVKRRPWRLLGRPQAE